MGWKQEISKKESKIRIKVKRPEEKTESVSIQVEEEKLLKKGLRPRDQSYRDTHQFIGK